MYMIIKWKLHIVQNKLSSDTNKSLKKLGDRGYPLKAVVWIQGEEDNKIHRLKINKSTNFDYKKSFNSMKSKILKGLQNKKDVKFIITQTSICENEIDNNLNYIKRNIANEDENIFLTEGTDNLGNKFRYDRCHFNQAGTEEISNEISLLLNNILTHKKNSLINNIKYKILILIKKLKDL